MCFMLQGHTAVTKGAHSESIRAASKDKVFDLDEFECVAKKYDTKVSWIELPSRWMPSWRSTTASGSSASRLILL